GTGRKESDPHRREGERQDAVIRRDMRDGSRKWIVAGAVGCLALAVGMVYAQPPGGFSGRGGRGGRGGFGRGPRGPAPAIFTAVDANKDGSITSAELKGAFDSWFTA